MDERQVNGPDSDYSGISGEGGTPKACGRLEMYWKTNWFWRVSMLLIGKENIILMKSNSFNAGRNLEAIASYSFIL